MKHKQWNFRHQPVGEVVLFWAVGHPGTTEIITCRRLSVLSASQTNSACCIHALLWHLYLPRHAVQKAEREGREHWTHGFMPCFVFLSFLFQFPLSHQFSLLLFIIIHPSSLLACLSVCLCLSLCHPVSLFSSSSLPFFCRCFNEIIFSGFSTKLPWGTSRNAFTTSLFWWLRIGIHNRPFFFLSKTTIHAANHCFSFYWLEGERIR